MDTTREAELVPIFYREPSREHRAYRRLVLSTLEQYMIGGERGASGDSTRALVFFYILIFNVLHSPARARVYLNQKLQEWWMTYNEQRPHSSIKHLTPIQFEEKNSLLYYKSVAA
jgi:transposase InsO family protein